MTSGEHRVFEARMSALPDTATFVEGFCSLHGIAGADVLRLTLIVEELFTNTVEHGCRGQHDASIHITLSADAGEVRLLYEDTAGPYDPLSRLSASATDLAVAPEQRPIGGLGIHLVRQLTRSARYVNEDGRNRLWLRLPRGN
jgi:serine/threonine-protein kinase RsbW